MIHNERVKNDALIRLGSYSELLKRASREVQNRQNDD